MSIHVHLERFEGPLGLLLHLIREQEMDIFNINIHHITRQYLEYIKAMRRLDLEVAGEFVAMAATLLHIKSKMLLPNYNEEGEEVEAADPRKELVQKLLEYKKFQELSADLYKRPLLGRDVFARGAREDVEALEAGELVLEEKPLFSLIAAYRMAVKNMKKTVHRVMGELQSIGARIMEIKDLLVVGKRVLFGELITDRTLGSNQVLVTFLSLLELAKMGFVSIFQTETLSEIHISPKKAIDRDVISQVENYESVNAEAAADKIMSEAAQLSLDEGVIPSAEDLAEGEVVVQESVSDAASDEDIDAEERRLFALGEAAQADMVTVAPENMPVAVAQASLPTEADSDEVFASPAADLNNTTAMVNATGNAETVLSVELADSLATPAEELSAVAETTEVAKEMLSSEAPPMDMLSPEALTEMPVDVALAALSESSLRSSPPTARVPVDLSFLTAPEVTVTEPDLRPEQAVLRAVSSALAAFDALSEPATIQSTDETVTPIDPVAPSRDPEVET